MGLDPKSLQHFMGHAEARTTMNIYTHASYEQAKNALTKVLKLLHKMLMMRTQRKPYK